MINTLISLGLYIFALVILIHTNNAGNTDGRHVFIYDAKNPERCEFLRVDSFPSLYNAGDYSLRDMIGDNE